MSAPELIPFMVEGPRPLLRDIPAGAAYPAHAPGPLTDVVQAVRGMTQASVAIPAASALAVASHLVQGFANVETLGGKRPTSLYALTIARSRERKSACDAPLMAQLRAFEKERARLAWDEIANRQNAHAQRRGEHDSILRKANQGNSEKRTAAQADLAALGFDPTAPPTTGRTDI